MNNHSRLLTAQFNITTPMFLGGADQKIPETIRPPSIKGALRFWWRALNWARIRTLHSSDKAALQQLHKEEGELFGGAHIHGRDDQGKEVVQAQQSRVALRISRQEQQQAEFTLSPGLQYLLGMGLYNFREGMLREAIRGSFTLDLHFAPTLSDDQRRQVEEAVLCFGLLGALGSRARHGWGSVSIERLKGGKLTAPSTIAEYKEQLRDILAKCEALQSEPPYSAFCSQSRVDISLQGRDPIALLRRLGDEQQMYRSWGQKGKVAGKDAERNFRDDHDWAYRVARGEPPATAPQRAIFGLPHNYFLSGHNNAKIDTEVTGNRRRASPLLAHIHQFPDGSCLLVQALLKSLFLPPELEMEVKVKNPRATYSVTVDPQWQVIHDFMNRFDGLETLYGH